MACTYRMKDAAGAWQTITGKPAMMAALADGRLDHLLPGGMVAAMTAAAAAPKVAPTSNDDGRLSESQARAQTEWRNLGQKGGTKTHALFFYETAADLSAKRGGMEYGRVEQYDGGKWTFNGESFDSLLSAKKAAADAAMPRLRADGFVTGETAPALAPAAIEMDAELQDALGHLGDVLGDVFGAKMNITGKQYGAGDLLPALSRVIELLVRKGFTKFVDATSQAARAMRASEKTAPFVDQVSPRQWKAAYNAIAEYHSGTDSEEG